MVLVLRFFVILALGFQLWDFGIFFYLFIVSWGGDFWFILFLGIIFLGVLVCLYFGFCIFKILGFGFEVLGFLVFWFLGFGFGFWVLGFGF